MGLIKAAMGAAGGVMADQWKEFFYCDAIPENVLAVKGQKKTSKRSSNTKGDDNVISNGSVIAVADGQCMLIVDQGKIVDMCAVAGEYTYDMSSEPSIFTGDLGDGIKNVFNNMVNRFTFGGEAPKDQRIYFFNTKELIGNKYGTPSPVPFRVVDQRAGIDIDVGIRCFGEYSYHISNPMLFYTNVCSNVSNQYDASELAPRLKSELMNALQPALATLSANKVQYYEIPAHTLEISDALNEQLSNVWRKKRGLEVFSFNINSLSIPEEQQKKITEWEENAMTTDPTTAAARLVGGQIDAMKTAAGNTAGAMTGFMGMGMAAGANGMNAQNLFAMGQQQQQQAQQQAAQAQQPAPAAPAQDSWKCSCGNMVSGNFCPNCGGKKPAPEPAAGAWKCQCGATATGKFCPECGSPKPADANGWTCSCGTVNKGKFCQSCGAKKPEGAPLYRCDKCGWEPEDPSNPPKFCPECGDIFDDNDKK